MNLKGLFVTVLTLLHVSSVIAFAASIPDDKEVLHHHLILAFNWSPRPADWEFSIETQQAVDRLAQYVLKDGQGADRKVLTVDDYYSCVAFRADVSQDHLKHFVQPIKYQDKPVLFQSGRDNNDLSTRIQSDWRTWLHSSPFSTYDNTSFSLLTVAKPYCLNYFARVQEKRDVNRTFMIVVSDRTFNGDMYNEVLNLRQYNISDHLTGIKDDDVYPICYAVNQSYFIRHIKTEKIRYGGGAWSNPKGYVDLYEFVPLQKNFKLATVLDMPAQVKAKRVRGNKYRCELLLNNRHHTSYKPIRLEASLDGKLLKHWSEDELEDAPSYTFEIESANRPDKLNLKGWVRLIDDVYNTTLLSPSPRAMEEAGRNGLNVDFEIEYEQKAKIFFFPMYDFFWFSFLPDDQATAALVWELIFGFIILMTAVVTIIYLFNKNQYFTPSVSDIEFKIS